MKQHDLNAIETPSVLVDYDKVRANIAWAQETASANRVVLRPHIKTHKSLQITRLQIEAGAVGITASKTDEALVFIEGGVKSVTVAYPQIDSRKMLRLLEAAKGHATDLRLTIDSIEGIRTAGFAAEELGFAVGVFIEIDVGLQRCGIKETDSRLLTFLQAIREYPNLTFTGLLSHAGHAYAARNADEVRAIAREEVRL